MYTCSMLWPFQKLLVPRCSTGWSVAKPFLVGVHTSNTSYRINIKFFYNKYHQSLAVPTPVNTWCDWNMTGTLAKLEISQTTNLTTKTWVSPALERKMTWPGLYNRSICRIWLVNRKLPITYKEVGISYLIRIRVWWIPISKVQI